MTLTLTNPPAEWFSAMQPGDKRVRSASLAALIQSPDVSFVSPSAVITRQDGAALTGSDLSVVGSPSVDSTGLIISATLLAGSNIAAYYVTFSAQGNSSGNPIYRSVGLNVTAVVG